MLRLPTLAVGGRSMPHPSERGPRLPVHPRKAISRKTSLFWHKKLPVPQNKAPCFLHQSGGRLPYSHAVRDASAQQRRPAGAASVALAGGAPARRRLRAALFRLRVRKFLAKAGLCATFVLVKRLLKGSRSRRDEMVGVTAKQLAKITTPDFTVLIPRRPLPRGKGPPRMLFGRQSAAPSFFETPVSRAPGRGRQREPARELRMSS